MQTASSKPNFLHFLNIGILTTAMLVGGILFFVLPQKKVSVIEKRALAKLPVFSTKSLASGAYTRDLDAYFADNFPYRDQFIQWSHGLRDLRGMTAAHKVKIIATVNPEFIPPDAGVISGVDSLKTPKDSAPKHSLFIYEGKAFQLFGSSKKMAAHYASCLNTFQKALGDTAKFYSLVIPSSSEMYLPEKYLKGAKSEKENIEAIYSYLNASICKADAYTPLKAHSSEYLYFGTDHHWTALGAYYAYTAFANCAGITPTPIENYIKKTKGDFLGTLYALSQDEELRKNPDHVVYYLIPGNYTVTVNKTSDEKTWTKGVLLAESAAGSASYGVFLGSDFPVMKIQSDQLNGRRILILKESFGNAFVPFLAPHYESIYVGDIRYFRFGLLDFIRKNNINEVLVINGIFMANNPYFGSKIKSMMYKPAQSLQPTKKEEKK